MMGHGLFVQLALWCAWVERWWWLALVTMLLLVALAVAHAQATPGTLYFQRLNGTPGWCSFTGVVKCPADTTPTPYPPPTGTRTQGPTP